MSVILGGVTLNESLQWTNRYEHNSMAQGVKRTLAGGAVVYQQPLIKALPIKLEATIDTGWFTFAMIEDIETLAAMGDTLHVLSFHGTIYNTIFDYAAGAYNFEQIHYRQVHVSEDRFTGTINLLTA